MTDIQGASFRQQWRNLRTMLKDFSISLRFSRNDGDFLNLSLIAFRSASLNYKKLSSTTLRLTYEINFT